MRKHIFFYIPVILSGIIFLSFNNKKDRINQSNSKNDSTLFIVKFVEGTVRQSSVTILDIVYADSAIHAVQKYIKPGHKSWKLHQDTKTQKYVRFENPASFVSDMVNYYAAQGGVPTQNKKGKYKFHITTTESDGMLGVTNSYVHFTWAFSAEEALKNYYREASSWKKDDSSRPPFFHILVDGNKTYTAYIDLDTGIQ